MTLKAIARWHRAQARTFGTLTFKSKTAHESALYRKLCVKHDKMADVLTEAAKKK